MLWGESVLGFEQRWQLSDVCCYAPRLVERRCALLSFWFGSKLTVWSTGV